MAILLSSVTSSFTYFIAVPTIIMMVFGRIIFGVSALEWLYVKLLQVKKSFYFSLSCGRWVYARVRVGILTPSIGQENDIAAALTPMDHSITYWERRIHAARIKAREEKELINQEKIDAQKALDDSDHEAIQRSTDRERERWAIWLELRSGQCGLRLVLIYVYFLIMFVYVLFYC